MLGSCLLPSSWYDYNFIDQNLQGKIAGNNWEFVSGKGRDYGNDGEVEIELHKITPAIPGDPLATGAYDAAEYFIKFEIPETLGLYRFSYYNMVTFDDEPGHTDYMTPKGAVEILTIDPVGGTITGRLDAYFNDQIYVNGNFNIAYNPGP